MAYVDPYQILVNTGLLPAVAMPRLGGASLIGQLPGLNQVNPVLAAIHGLTGPNTGQPGSPGPASPGPSSPGPAENTIPPAPTLPYSWSPEYQTNTYVVPQVPGLTPQPMGNLLTRESAEGLARLLGGRVVNTGGPKGPFTFPDTWDVELPNGNVVSSSALATYWKGAQSTWDQAVKDYELNRQFNSGLFTKGPGFTMPRDPLSEIQRMIETEQNYRPNWDKILGSTPATTSTTQTTPTTQTTTQTTPTTTTSRTWYNFYRLENPLGDNTRQVENAVSPGLQQFGNNVVNAQAQGVPLGSPAARVERVTETTSPGGPAQTGTSTIDLGPKQALNSFVQNPNDIAGLWQRSWQMYGGRPADDVTQLTDEVVGPQGQRPSFFTPWATKPMGAIGQTPRGPVQQGYSTTFNPYGRLPF
jgi:hypothetical protein